MELSDDENTLIIRDNISESFHIIKNDQGVYRRSIKTLIENPTLKEQYEN